MKEFKVWAKMTSYCYTYVEAETKEEAIEKALNIDGGDFAPDDNPYSGSWEIVNVEE